MTPKKLAKVVKKLDDQYDKAFYALAKRVRDEHVVPFCNRTGLRFKSGMGGWTFYRGPDDWPERKPPKRLDAMLSEGHIDGYQALGSMMDDYTPPNYRGKL